MNKSTIQTLIDKVIGKKGLIRVPSWWMRKVLMQMADWVQEGDDANGERIAKVKEEADGKISTLDNNTKAALVELKKSLHTQKCFVVKTGANAGYVVVDGVTQDIPANTQKIVTYTDTFNFYNKKTTNQGLTFIGLAVADTSSITDMSYMFASCAGLKSIDLSGLDTSAVTNMSYLFSSCSSLSSINLSGLDTPTLTNMNNMFRECLSLTSLDLTGFNTSMVTDMSSMFYYCENLTSINLSELDTSSVTNMSYMFNSCRGLTSLDLSKLDTSAVTNMSNMFSCCSKLSYLNLSGFNTSAVTDMSNMFSGYTYEGEYYGNIIKSLDLSSFDTSAVTNMDSMFDNCKYLTYINLSSFNTSTVTNMHRVFGNCTSLTSIDLTGFDTSAVTSMGNIFLNCSSLASLILGPNFFKAPNVTSVDFSSCTNWTNDTVVTSLVTNSYDRATAGLKTMTLQLSANTKAALTDEQKATITAKGYTIA